MIIFTSDIFSRKITSLHFLSGESNCPLPALEGTAECTVASKISVTQINLKTVGIKMMCFTIHDIDQVPCINIVYKINIFHGRKFNFKSLRNCFLKKDRGNKYFLLLNRALFLTYCLMLNFRSCTH